jgi:hypothetical protein
MAAPQSPTIPNVQQIDHALNTTKDEVVRVANVPAWDGGAAITARLGQLLTQMDDMEARMDDMVTRMDDMVTRMDDMATRTDQVETGMGEMETRMDEGFQQVHQCLTAIDTNIQTHTTRLDATQHNASAPIRKFST